MWRFCTVHSYLPYFFSTKKHILLVLLTRKWSRTMRDLFIWLHDNLSKIDQHAHGYCYSHLRTTCTSIIVISVNADMVRHAIRAGFIEMYRMTLNDRTDFERSPKPNGTPIFCPQQILENYFPPLKHPKMARLWGVGFGAI